MQIAFKSSLYLYFLFLALILPSHAEILVWRNKNSSKSIRAKYLDHDETHLSLRTEQGKKVRIALENMHPVDLARLDSFKEAELKAQLDEEVDGFPSYGLNFGESRAEIIPKIQDNPLLEARVNEAFILRGGMNESYQSKALYGGFPVRLSFFFGQNNILREITLKTPPFSKKESKEKLADPWDALGLKLIKLFGEPRSATEYPDYKKIEEGAIICSHYWVTKQKHHILLGIGRESNQYNVIVRVSILPPE